MRLAQIVHKSGTASTWTSSVEHRDDGTHVCSVFHHGHWMLNVKMDDAGNYIINHLSLGHGSVSDQGGMTTIFGQLGIRLRMRRDAQGGGPRWETFDAHTQRRLNARNSTTHWQMRAGSDFGKLEEGMPLADPDLDPFECLAVATR